MNKREAAVHGIANIVGANAAIALLARAKAAVEARAGIDLEGEMVRHLTSLLAAALPLHEGDQAALVCTTAQTLRQHRIARGSVSAARALLSATPGQSSETPKLTIPPPPAALVPALATLQLSSAAKTPCAFTYNIIVNCERALEEPIPVPAGI